MIVLVDGEAETRVDQSAFKCCLGHLSLEVSGPEWSPKISAVNTFFTELIRMSQANYDKNLKILVLFLNETTTKIYTNLEASKMITQF